MLAVVLVGLVCIAFAGKKARVLPSRNKKRRPWSSVNCFRDKRRLAKDMSVPLMDGILESSCSSPYAHHEYALELAACHGCDSTNPCKAGASPLLSHGRD